MPVVVFGGLGLGALAYYDSVTRYTNLCNKVSTHSIIIQTFLQKIDFQPLWYPLVYYLKGGNVENDWNFFSFSFSLVQNIKKNCKRNFESKEMISKKSYHIIITKVSYTLNSLNNLLQELNEVLYVILQKKNQKEN